MSLEEKTTEDKIEVLESGHVQVRSKTVILKDGEPIAENYHRKVISPGDDYSEESERVQAICSAIHTQEVIDEYLARLEASNPTPPEVVSEEPVSEEPVE